MVVTAPAGLTARSRALTLSATNAVPPPSTATPDGVLKRAAAPVASTKSFIPLSPASDDTRPAAVATRTRAPSVKVTLSPGAAATPRGAARRALAPTPSAVPDTVVTPASVDTLPSGVTRRSVRPGAASATTAFPFVSTVTAVGALKDAAEPTPLAPPGSAAPASVDTTPAGEMIRRRLLPRSATSTLPPSVTATPYGELKAAAVPSPSAKLGAPVPAIVVTTPAGVTRRMRCPVASATATSPLANAATPAGFENCAAAPVPSAPPSAPPPASVVTSQKHGGCTMSPPTGHADAGRHGAGGVPPPAQKKPGAHAAGRPAPAQ